VQRTTGDKLLDIIPLLQEGVQPVLDGLYALVDVYRKHMMY